jgi:hypothetical protein
MQAVVKTPHIEVNIKGMIPQKLISLLKLCIGLLNWKNNSTVRHQ